MLRLDIRVMSCFNPRPLLLTGESGGAIPDCRADTRFNPRPLLLTGESGAWFFIDLFSIGFNPRPLLLTGESQKAVLKTATIWWFQSTPVIANGRI